MIVIDLEGKSLGEFLKDEMNARGLDHKKIIGSLGYSTYMLERWKETPKTLAILMDILAEMDKQEKEVLNEKPAIE